MATQSFNLWTEPLDDTSAMVHCEVSEWSLGVARQLDEAVADLMDQLLGEGVDRMFTVSPNSRFCEYMGGERIGHVYYENQDYGVYVWDLAQPHS